MSNTTSLNFPYMFNVSQNRVSIISDNKAIANRTRLLILTDPTELYNNPDFGVGIRKHMWKYNTDNEKAIILDNIKSQLKLHEPYTVAEDTSYADGLLFTGGLDEEEVSKVNELEMTIALNTTFKQQTTVRIGEEDISLG